MDSPAEGSRNADPAGDDLISGLADDVLLHILELVAEAEAADLAAARMSALSRRWLELWARVPALRFACRVPDVPTSRAERSAALERYVSSVNGALARRRSTQSQSGCAAAIESLAISCATGSGRKCLEQLMPPLMDAARGWIRYISQHGLKRFVLDLDCHDRLEHEERDWKKAELVLLLDDDDDEPPRLLQLETMRLALSGVRLRLPAATAAMRFASLRDLSLERIRITGDGNDEGHLLGHFLSSASCPCLQKLRLNKVWISDNDNCYHQAFRLEAKALSELWVEQLRSASLELRTPSLRVLHIDKCCFHKAIRIFAPRLQHLKLFIEEHLPPECLEIDDGDSPQCLQRLKLCIWSHRHQESNYGEAGNHSNTILLNHYSSVTCLDVTLEGGNLYEDDVDLIESGIPHLPHITSLTVNVSHWFKRHDFGVSVASLLTRFSNLRHLSLHLSFLYLHYDLELRLGLECYHEDCWTSREISMDHLEEVELSGLTGTDCELWLMKAIITSAKGLRKVAISFNSECQQHQGKMDSLNRMLLDEGMQTSHPDTFMLHACI